MSDPPATRRLAAILMADVVGYSGLVERDEAGTLAALNLRRDSLLIPLLASHRGRLVQQVGDGFQVEFASAVDAVRCAVELQAGMEAANAEADADPVLRFRIGINVGDVVVEGAYIQGDGVNIAARLEALADPGGVCISASVHEQVERQLAICWEDLGARELKNIARPVHLYRLAAVGGWALGKTSQPQAAAPSIAVLPFTNMSGDPEQEYFADGVTEDIITELSRFRSLFVIARNSTFVFKGRSVKVQDVARELGVGYVVEGSVRRAGSRVRVTAQLINAATGHHLWADRYDRSLEDIFALQDELATRIVTSIEPALVQEATMRARRRAPEDLLAHEHYLRAKVLVDVAASMADLRTAREHCRTAIRIDPTHARAQAYLAFTYVIGVFLDPSGFTEADSRQALAAAERAVDLDPNDNVCHWSLGETAFNTGQVERGLRHIDRAVTLNPNDADTLLISGYMQCARGDADLGLRQLAMAVERNPFKPSWYCWVYGVGLSLHGRYDEALEQLDSHLPGNPAVMRWRAYTLMKLGRIVEAKALVRDGLAVTPNLRARDLGRSVEAARIRDDFIATLRAAGVPD